MLCSSAGLWLGPGSHINEIWGMWVGQSWYIMITFIINTFIIKLIWTKTKNEAFASKTSSKITIKPDIPNTNKFISIKWWYFASYTIFGDYHGLHHYHQLSSNHHIIIKFFIKYKSNTNAINKITIHFTVCSFNRTMVWW